MNTEPIFNALSHEITGMTPDEYRAHNLACVAATGLSLDEYKALRGTWWSPDSTETKPTPTTEES